jgi:1-aminocyclopropane-1-carboxylate deaminase
MNYIPKINTIKFQEFSADVLRLDLIHPQISGNKWFKLKHNLDEAKAQGLDTILTFGGAFSNHIYAAAFACKLSGLKSIGIIRGEETPGLNPTLTEAQKNGMQLHFISRISYKNKTENTFIENLKNKFGNFYLIPEGGNNILGALGCSEIIDEKNDSDYIFCACGTATTFAGLAKHLKPQQKLIGISVLKGEQTIIAETQELINKLRGGNDFTIAGNDVLLNAAEISASGIINAYTFGGYAKHANELLLFKDNFENEYKIILDHVYTSKLFYGVFDLIKKRKLKPGSKILVIHSGGLQGNAGFEKRYELT